jgi:hypothetical protein
MKNRERIDIAVALVVIVLVALSIISYMFYNRPIVASKEALILNEYDLAGWDYVKTVDPVFLNNSWRTGSEFQNASVSVGSNLSIGIYSFWTTLGAQNQYSKLKNENSSKDGISITSLDFGDEGFFYLSQGTIANPNGTYDIGHNGTMGRYHSAYVNYMFRDGNILILITFETNGYSLDPSISYHLSWMDDIVQMQADKVHRNIVWPFSLDDLRKGNSTWDKNM